MLLILVDDLKPAMGCYGDPVAQTPNMDALASRGMRFELAHCNQAVCAPSRFTLMLGSHSTSTGLYGLGSPLRKIVPHSCRTFKDNQTRLQLFTLIASPGWRSHRRSSLATPNRQFHSLNNRVFEGNLRASEPTDAKKPVRYTTSEANKPSDGHEMPGQSSGV